MIRNHFKTAWRTLISNPTYTATNLIGLTLGLAVVMLIATRVLDELSYDQHWTQKNELYRIQTNYKSTFASQSVIDGAPQGMTEALMTDFPEITEQAHINISDSKLMLDSLVGRYAELPILETNLSFFDLFDTESIEGNPRQISPHIKNLVITESAHLRHFNGEDVIGKIFYTIPDYGETEPYLIHAIIRDLPDNTHLKADAILITPQPRVFVPDQRGGFLAQYMLVKNGTDTAALTAKINSWYGQKISPDTEQTYKFVLQSIKDVHLRSVTGWNSPMRDIYLLTGIGLLILILVCINYINLTFAHAVQKTIASGVRKVLGAKRMHFFYQIGAESMMLFGISLLLAYVLYFISLPAFEALIGQPLTLSFHYSPRLFGGLLALWLVLGLLCSLFPAFAISKTKISQGLKRQLSVLSLPMNRGFTKGLVTVQFSIAIIVIICMFTIGAQLRYMQNKDLGYEPKNLLTIDYSSWDGKGLAFKETLLQQTGVRAVSFSQWTPFVGSVDIYPLPDPEDPDNKEKNQALISITADFDFPETMGLQFVEGRALNPKYADDAGNITMTNILISELGEKNLNLRLGVPLSELNFTPVGIIQDVHAANLRHPISNISIGAFPNSYLEHQSFQGVMLIRAESGKNQEVLAAISDTWKEFFPGQILPRTHWVEDQVHEQYIKERKQYQQLMLFGMTSMLIALLGVLGLAIYTVEIRIKEIGIRKVLGASVRSIIALLSTSFVKPVLLSTLLAIPVAWWMMHGWLENFAYRIGIPIQLFALTGILALISMLSVVGWQAARAARVNPVDSLRDE